MFRRLDLAAGFLQDILHLPDRDAATLHAGFPARRAVPEADARILLLQSLLSEIKRGQRADLDFMAKGLALQQRGQGGRIHPAGNDVRCHAGKVGYNVNIVKREEAAPARTEAGGEARYGLLSR